MRNSLIPIAFCCLAALCRAQTTAPDGDKLASVEGQVNQAMTGEPLIHAHVILRGFSGGSMKQYGGVTTAEGKFALNGIPAGSYSVTVDKTGFVAPPGPDSRVSVQLKESDRKFGLKLKLLPTGAITGRVLDQAGDPIEAAQVIVDGPTTQSGPTDERGYFRLGGLAPGKYRVRAALNNGLSLPPETRTDGTQDLHCAATWSPGVASAKEATRIEVRPSGESGGADIQMRLTPWVRVSGRVFGLPEGMDRATLMARPAGLFTAGSFSRVRADGTFELWHIDAGKYVIGANWQGSGNQLMKTVDLDIEVAASNIDGLELRFVPPSDLVGRVDFEDDAARQAMFPKPPAAATSGSSQQKTPPPPAQPPSLMLQDLTTFASVPGIRIGDDGAFLAKGVPAGRYQIKLLAHSVYISSMRLGTQNSEGNRLDLRNGSAGAELSLMVSSKVASVSGIVSDERGPVAGAHMVLVVAGQPDSFLQRLSGTSDETGKYQILNVPPGSYRLVDVTESDTDTVMQRNGRLDDYENLMEPVEIHPEDKIVKDLKRRTPAE
jgi:hypothetical protein